MDAFFREAREYASGEKDDEATRPWKRVEGQRAIAIVTPGRLIMFDPCPEPNSMPEEKVAPMRQLMPPDPSRKITAICYTFVEALITDIDKAIPFRGFLNAWAYLGHSVLVFEGHASAFDAGVRDCDVLVVDSAMLSFVPITGWMYARHVISRRIEYCSQSQNYSLRQVFKPATPQTPKPNMSSISSVSNAVIRASVRDHFWL